MVDQDVEDSVSKEVKRRKKDKKKHKKKRKGGDDEVPVVESSKKHKKKHKHKRTELDSGSEQGSETAPDAPAAPAAEAPEAKAEAETVEVEGTDRPSKKRKKKDSNDDDDDDDGDDDDGDDDVESGDDSKEAEKPMTKKQARELAKKERKRRRLAAAAAPVDFFRCDTCLKEFNSEFQFKEHNASKGHAKKLRRTENANRNKARFTLFVGQLSQDSSVNDIRDHFRNGVDGNVTVRLLSEPKTGVSRGIAFVEFDTVEDVEKGLAMHHSTLHDRRINVERTAAGGGKGEHRQSAISALRTVQRRQKQEETMAIIERFCFEHPDDLLMADVDARVRSFLETIPGPVATKALQEFLETDKSAIANRPAYLMSIIRRISTGETRGSCFKCGEVGHLKSQCPLRHQRQQQYQHQHQHQQYHY